MTSTHKTEIDEQSIRESIEHWIIITGSSHSDTCLHIPHDNDQDKPLCNYKVESSGCHYNKDSEWRKKPVDVFPPGYKQICQSCYQIYHGLEVDDDRTGRPIEDYENALFRVIEEKDGDLLTRADYRRLKKDHEPCSSAVANNLADGTWHKVRVRYNL